MQRHHTWYQDEPCGTCQGSGTAYGAPCVDCRTGDYDRWAARQRSGH